MDTVETTTIAPENVTQTNFSHLAFGIIGSERAWHHRKTYLESWWRPNITKGLLYLDADPTGDVLPWSPSWPPYNVSSSPGIRIPNRLFQGILEVFRVVDNENLRWLIMGDDDSIFFLDNIIDVLRQYDHTKYYYIGGLTEWFLADYWFAFDMAYGGGGIVLSYPLAKALAGNIENCSRTYGDMKTYDLMVMACIWDMGVAFTPHKGMHQVPLLSLHRMHDADPYFPGKNHTESLRHLMKAAAIDQSRILQMTICHYHSSNWSISISWGYSAHIYESIFPRSYLQKPIETFRHWTSPNQGPNYIFDIRTPSRDPCEAPHAFFFEGVESRSNLTLTTYRRWRPRSLKACERNGNHTADFVSEIHVYSPSFPRRKIDRCECCHVVRLDGGKVEINYRECGIGETIA